MTPASPARAASLLQVGIDLRFAIASYFVIPI
jgi:hypothetical protein